MKSRKNIMSKVSSYLPVFIILLSITIIVGSTFAYFTDRKEEESNLTFSKVELSSETTTGINGALRDVIPGTKLVDGALSFSKSIDSEPIYVRAKISFSLPVEYKEDEDMIALLDALRSATDFNIMTDEQHDAVWSAKDGNYYYLLNANETSKLMRVETIDTYVLSNEVVVPRDLENLPNNAQYMKGINFHIAFEAIQADNVSDVLADTKETFNTLFPANESEKYVSSDDGDDNDGDIEEETGIIINVLDTDLTSVHSKIELTEAGTIDEPVIEMPVDANGTSTKAIEGWYTDSEFSNKFNFYTEVAESISLYPKSLDISTGLQYTALYENPDSPSEITGYSVAQGSCSDTIIVIPEYYKGVPVTAIASYAFQLNRKITNVIIPNTLTKFDMFAFYMCSALKSITIPKGVTVIGNDVFWNCTALEEIIYKATNLSDLTSHVFNDIYSANKETIVYIDAEVSKIPAYLLGASSSGGITKVVFEKGSQCESIGEKAFYNDIYLEEIVNLPDSITSIGTNAFYCCKVLNGVDMPSSLTSIGANAFFMCYALTEITLPSELKTIGVDSFNSCTGVVTLNFNATNMDELVQNTTPFSGLGTSGVDLTLNIGRGVEKIPAYLFKGLTNITSLVFEDGSNCTTIGVSAFDGCAGLSNALTIPEKITTLGNSAFSGCTNINELNYNAILANDLMSNNNVFYNLGKDKGNLIINIGNEVTRIPNYMFRLSTLTNVNFEEGSVCRSIGSNAIGATADSFSMELPESLVTIDAEAFNGCFFKTINIPENVTSIGNEAFKSCYDLTEVNFNAIELNDLSSTSYVFRGVASFSGAFTVNIGAKVTKIPAYLFYDGTSGAKIDIVNFEEGSVCRSIGSYAFYYAKIKSINLPSSINTIGQNAFSAMSGYVLCTNDTIAGLAVSAAATNVYVLDSSTSLSSVSFTGVSNGGEVNGTYSDGTNTWVRVGTEGSYTYYKKYTA